MFLSFNYPQRDVWPLFIWSNLCCFYRSIILNAPFDHCLYEATFVVFILQLSSTRRLKQLFLSYYPQREATFVVFILQLSSTRRLSIVYIKQPFFYRWIILNAPFTLFTLSNICYFYRSIFLNAPFSHCLYEATFDVFILQLSSTRRLAIDYIKQPFCFYRSIILNDTFDHCLYEATFVVFIVQLSSTRRLAIVYMKQPLLFLSCNYTQHAV